MNYIVSRIKIYYEVIDTGLGEVIKTFTSVNDVADWYDNVRDIVVFNQGTIEYTENRVIHSASLDPLDYDVLVYNNVQDFLQALTV